MPQLYVATNGLSIWHSSDLGETLERMPSSTGLYSGSRVWSLLATPGGLLAGTESGIYLWHAAGKQFITMPSPIDCQLVTALACAPDNSDLLLAGTQPGAIFRSDNGGRVWTKVDVPIQPHVSSGFRDAHTAAETRDRPIARHWTRITQIVFDPNDGNKVWAGVEIGGAWHSQDAGRTWTRRSDGLKTDDVHGFAIVNNGSRLIYATTNKGFYVSPNDGQHWEQQLIDSPWQYTRTVQPKADGSSVMFLTNGEGAPGQQGRLFRSEDFGRHWTDVSLPGDVESSVYFLATHESDPDLVFAATALGQLYRSTDGGVSWSALKRRLGEVRAVAWLPD
jgi:photosystem II stability/assembly factor-like uncharacterized protein